MRIRVAIALSVMFISGCAMTSGPAPAAEGAKTRAEVRGLGHVEASRNEQVL